MSNLNFQLKAEKRAKTGSLEARRIKKSGKIPAVIYSKSGNINISLDKREFESEFLKGNIQTRIAEIQIEGKVIKAITHRVELDPVSDTPVHVDLLNCQEAKEIKAQPRINFINQDKCIGLKKGGFLHIVSRKVEIICKDGANIPQLIDVDVARLQVGQKIRANQINLPEGVKFRNNTNFLIASITGRGKAEEEASVADASGAAAGAAGGAPAAGTPSSAAAASAGAKSEDKKPAAKK